MDGWTDEMLLVYVTQLHEVAQGDRLRLLEVVKIESTVKLVEAVKRLLGVSPHRFPTVCPTPVVVPRSVVRTHIRVDAVNGASDVSQRLRPKHHLERWRKGEWWAFVARLLTEGPMTIQEIARATGDSNHETDVKMRNHVIAGRAVRFENGRHVQNRKMTYKYQLTANGARQCRSQTESSQSINQNAQMVSCGADQPETVPTVG